MKTLILNNKKYIIPEKWSEVSLAMQMKVTEDTEKITAEELKKFAILSGYAGVPIDELKKAKLTELVDVFKAVDFINQPLPTNLIVDFDFNGKHYYVGQNLLEMQFQDFISIENTLSDYSGNTVQALPIILAIMCKQKKSETEFETIDDYDVKARAKEFMDLPMTIAHQVSLFFSTSEKLFGNLIPSFSSPDYQRAVVQKQIEETENTLKKLDGKGWLTRCVTLILRYLLKYIKRKLDKHFTSIQ
mgnify:CR=1 FL=1